MRRNSVAHRARRLALCALLTTLSALRQASAQQFPYRDPRLAIERRVNDLLSRMTLEEKVAQMLCLWGEKKLITDDKGFFNSANAPKWFRVGIGRIERPQDGHDARGEATFVNAIQRWVHDSTRLGIPVLFNEEALHGLEAGGAARLPQAIAPARAWNADLREHRFTATAAAARPPGPGPGPGPLHRA